MDLAPPSSAASAPIEADGHDEDEGGGGESDRGVGLEVMLLALRDDDSQDSINQRHNGTSKESKREVGER